jgi:hypothetical protein
MQSISKCTAFTNGGTTLILKCFGQFVLPLRRMKLGVNFENISYEDTVDVPWNWGSSWQRFLNVKLLSKRKAVLPVNKAPSLKFSQSINIIIIIIITRIEIIGRLSTYVYSGGVYAHAIEVWKPFSLALNLGHQILRQGLAVAFAQEVCRRILRLHAPRMRCTCTFLPHMFLKVSLALRAAMVVSGCRLT